MEKKRRGGRNAILWTIAGGIILLGLIVIVSAYGETPRGTAIIENPAVLMGGVVTMIGAVLTSVLPIILRAEKNQEVVVEQLQNDHRHSDGSPFLMRDDMDKKHEDVLEQIAGIQAKLNLAVELSRGTAVDVRDMRREVGNLHQSGVDNARETRAATQVASDAAHAVSGLVRTVEALQARVDRYHPEA